MSVYFGTYRERNLDQVHAVARIAAVYGADAFIQIDPIVSHAYAKVTRTDIEVRHVHSLADAGLGDVKVVALETGGKELGPFEHPENVLYVVGPQIHTLPEDFLREWADYIVTVETPEGRPLPTNVVAGVVLYDRWMKTL